MDSSALISVIVPVYQVEDYLDRAIESIVCQSYRNLEIILVDDGAPDRSPAICDEWAQKDSRILVIHKENNGVSSARNAGLRIATGEWVSFVDADDWIHPQFFELLQLQSTKYSDADLITANMEQVHDISPFRPVSFENCDFSLVTADDIFRNRTIKNYVWGRIIRKRILNNISFDEELKFGEDGLFNAQLLSDESIHLYYSNEIIYFYFQRFSSAVHRFSLNQLYVLQQKYLDLAKKETRGFPQSIYLIEGMKRALAARLYSQNKANKEMTDELNISLRSASALLRKNKNVSLKNKAMLSVFAFCPQLYRLVRIIDDPTLLKTRRKRRSH